MNDITPEQIAEMAKNYHKEISARGGSSKTKKKQQASRNNIAKAREARLKKLKCKKSEGNNKTI